MSAPKELSNLGADVSEMGSTSSLRLYLTCEMHRGEIVVIFRFHLPEDEIGRWKMNTSGQSVENKHHATLDALEFLVSLTNATTVKKGGENNGKERQSQLDPKGRGQGPQRVERRSEFRRRRDEI